MTLEVIGFLIILSAMIFCFLTERIRPDLAALCGLMVLVFAGYLPARDAFSGFSSSASLTLVPMFIIGAGLKYSGISERIAAGISRIAGSSERGNVAAVMILGVLVSSVMNNVAVVAMLMPAVMALSRRSTLPPSLLLMPLSFAALLGGTLTMIGTAPNLVATEILRSKGLHGFSFFTYTPFGVLICAFGVLFFVFAGVRLLPRNTAGGDRRRESLPELYRLHERIFSLRVPENSSLHGESLSALHFGENLDLGVVAIIRDGRKILSPGPREVALRGDTLIVRGRFHELEVLLRFKGLMLESLSPEASPEAFQNISLQAIRVESALTGKRLPEVNIKSRFGAIVWAIERDGDLIFKELSSEKLKEGDLIYVASGTDRAGELAGHYGCTGVSQEHVTKAAEKGGLFRVTVPGTPGLSGLTFEQSKMGELAGLTALMLVREGEARLVTDRKQVLQAGDVLMLAGDRGKASLLARLGELEVISSSGPLPVTELESDDVGIAEVVLSPRSQLIGKTLAEIGFREKYDMQVLAIWHEGQPLRARLARTVLKFGDALLLQGPRTKMALFARDTDFLFLGDPPGSVTRGGKAPVAIACFFLMIIISGLGIQPPEVAAWSAALLIVLSGTISMEEAYREVDWRIVMLVSALLPLGIAFEQSGAAGVLSGFMIDSLSGFGAVGVILGLSVSASFVSQSLDGSLAVVLFVPVAVSVAQSLGLNPYPFVMAIALSASNAFLTPFSHRAHLLVMGAAGYRKMDYFRVGVWMTFLNLAALLTGLYFFGGYLK